MLNFFFSRNNVEIYSKAGQPIGDNITWRMFFACWLQTHAWNA